MLDHYRPLIEQALKDAGSSESADRVLEECEAGRAFIIASPSRQTIAILQPVTHQTLHVWGVAGDMTEVLDLETAVTQEAKRRGIDQMSTTPSRDGWDRVLKDRNWKPALVKDL